MERGPIESLVHRLFAGLYGIPVLGWLIPIVLVLGMVALAALVLIWLERKVSGHIQSRRGPLHNGPHGLLQTVWDALKLLVKEDIVPSSADRLIMLMAPFVVFTPAVLVYVVMPFGKGWTVANLNIGLLWVVSVLSLGPVGIILGGWGSHNKWSLLGGMRSAAQLISYEIPSVLALGAIVMMAGTMSMDGLVAAQDQYEFVLTPPGLIAFVVYLVTALAELNRNPFDLPEAESELVAGFVTEYSGFKFAIFFLAEFANLLALSMITVTVFLGGWQPPSVLFFLPDSAQLPGVFWFAIKTTVMVFVFQWIKWTLPRLRIDQMLNVCWKGLIPITLGNLALACIWLLLTEKSWAR